MASPSADRYPLGVGIVGAGSVVQGIHLPTLAQRPDQFRVRHLTDIDLDTARSIAARVGATASSSLDDLLADPTVDVVAVCSPHQLHDEHVLAACESGVRAVLCEKPLATTVADARRIADAAHASGTPVIVGSMHLFDPAWTFLQQHTGALADDTHTVRSNIILPFNERFEAWATEPAAPGPLPSVDHSSAEGRADSLALQLLGLAIHDIPLVRSMTPAWEDIHVVSAGVLEPLGYRVLLRVGHVLVELSGGFRDHWETEWEFEAIGPHCVARAEFTPSYVQAGSGTATVETSTGTMTFNGEPGNGYRAEWMALVEAARRPESHKSNLDNYVADLDFTLRIVDRASQFLRQEAS